VVEAPTGSYLGEDGIVRIENDYRRSQHMAVFAFGFGSWLGAADSLR
jgi:hypothetical protein